MTFSQLGPTIITDVQPHMRCYREEIFGPVLVCLSVPTMDDAISLINANEYGNGVAIFTRSGSSAGRYQLLYADEDSNKPVEERGCRGSKGECGDADA